MAASDQPKKKNAGGPLVDEMNHLSLRASTNPESDKQTKSQKRKAARECRVNAIVAHFEEHYESKPSKLQAYQKLCEDLGVDVGTSITQCRKILNSVFVNIVDFVKTPDKKTVHQFLNIQELRDYSRKKKKLFPLIRAKEDTVLRALLVKMF
ncbi:hypothetical protein HII31_13585 [Pseudocercospora fuligena]|uniref:Uncharacterized protein n=1 Tax=Pseudocercospora fuligena TaxID=685502 RepID=A0A8H6VBW3_9PEZI|nr:hypothetical protein HII31_13585 [Pseudocercospora fuligena]